jgi:hypothetical protein
VRVNERGTGDAQYPPRLLLGLLLYQAAEKRCQRVKAW